MDGSAQRVDAEYDWGYAMEGSARLSTRNTTVDTQWIGLGRGILVMP